jgi:hypothetical protein
MSKVITFVAALVLGAAGGFGLAHVGSEPVQVVTGLQPKYETGFVVEVPCPDHGVDEFTVGRVLVAYELQVEGSPMLSLATEEQIDQVLAQPK